MTVRLIEPRDPRKIPEHVLWTLRKGERRAEARVRMTPIGPELRFFATSQTTGELDLLWSMIYKDGEGGNLGDDADLKRREFLRRGWEPAPVDEIPAHVAPESCGKCADGWICESHPNEPWPHPKPGEPGHDCEGPGMPCDCPIGVRLVAKLDDEHRH